VTSKKSNTQSESQPITKGEIMLSQKETNKSTVTRKSSKQKANAINELRSICEFGRALNGVFSAYSIANIAALEVQKIIALENCAVFLYTNENGLIGTAFNNLGETITESINTTNIKNWLAIQPSGISFWQKESEDLFLTTSAKTEKTEYTEYIAPLLINEEVRGAIVCGFDSERDCVEKTRRFIEAIAQITVLSASRAMGYGKVLAESVNNARKEQQIFTDAVLDSLPVSLYVVDRDFRVVAWNRHREIGVLGLPREEVIGRNIFDFLTKQPRTKLIKEFNRAFQTGEIERIEQHTIDPDGVTRHWLVSKIPMRDRITNEVTHVITVGEDITMRVDAMRAVTRAEKLAAVGRLAAGVVHEINNPLATISACAEALETRVMEGVFGDSDEIIDLREYLGLIRSEAFRCKSITNGLLDFSRVRSGNRVPLDISDVLKSSARLLSHQKRGDDIKISVEVPSRLLLVSADEGQLQQAVIALATNAIDSMPEGGDLVLRAYAEANRVVVEVKDSGIGISSEDLPKIFEPFFTTKEVGKGTGLGLAVCYGIITEHGGRLSVRSTPGSGTTFTMFLPAQA
jgi:two-component system, NtrC family, sensor kinase